jgi:hypothetical protein
MANILTPQLRAEQLDLWQGMKNRFDPNFQR